MLPILYIVIPCYNEEKVLPITSALFLDKLHSLEVSGKISPNSRILLVNDGSKDSTWEIMCSLSEQHKEFSCIGLSRNFGHQGALLSGLMEAKEHADIVISIDCDGQDDINAMDEMVEAYNNGADVVYGVRKSRKTDTFFKRTTAQFFYKLMSWLGADTVYNHADYRLMSKRVIEALSDFEEVNIFLRGMIPLVGFNSTIVYYERHERMAGNSHYPLAKMLSFAIDGITSLSIKPIRLITLFGCIISVFGFVGVIWAIITFIMGNSVAGWSSLICIICFMGGIQLLSLGIIGEYVGKIYLESKHRPKYIVKDKRNLD